MLSACDPSIKCDSVWFVYYINIAFVWYADADSDGYGTPGNSVYQCIQPAGYVSNNDDCNDADASVHYNTPEICGNGLDDNCNGEIDEGCGRILLNLRLFLEGLYLNNNTQQPVLFNTGIYNNSIVSDVVTIELHDEFSPYSTVLTQNAIVNINGYASVHLPAFILGGSYYITVRSRNGIKTWSKFPVSFDDTPVDFDFTAP